MNGRKQRLIALCTGLSASLAMLTVPVSADSGTEAEWSGTFSSVYNNTVTDIVLPSASDTVEKVWESPVGSNTIVILDGNIYTYNGINSDLTSDYSDGGTFYRIDADSGEILDSLECEYGTRFYYSYSIYADGLIYVGCPTAILAFDPASFSLVWEKEVPERYYPTLQYIGGCIVSNGIVLNARNGKTIAELSGNWGSGWSNGAEAAGYFYVSDTKENLYAVSTDTWQITDTIRMEESAGASCPGVLYDNGVLYWSGIHGNLHSVSVSDGDFRDSTLKTTETGIKCYGTPAAANGRIYLAGMTQNSLSTNQGNIVVCVFDAGTMEHIYTTQNDSLTGKIQNTPLLYADGDGTVRVYVQGYKKPGIVYVLEDTVSQTSGTLEALLEPPYSNYAWGQLACDRDGALYCTNDEGYLLKYRAEEKIVIAGGDVNGDQSVDLLDVLRLAQYLADWEVYADLSEADLNRDGRVDITDNVMLRRYLAGWYSR